MYDISKTTFIRTDINLILEPLNSMLTDLIDINVSMRHLQYDNLYLREECRHKIDKLTLEIKTCYIEIYNTINRDLNRNYICTKGVTT